MLGIAVDGLMQDGHEEEGPLGAGGGLGQFLKHENVALIGIRGSVFKKLAKLVHDQEDTAGGMPEALQVIPSFLEQPDDGRPRHGSLLRNPLQPLDDLRRPASLCDGAEGRSQACRESLLQRLPRAGHQNRA